MNPVERTSFEYFLGHLMPHDVSLAILPDGAYLRECVALSDALGFSRCTDALEIARKMTDSIFRVYIEVPDGIPKQLYDLIVQYPTRSVQLTDTVSMKEAVFHPVCSEGNAVLVLATRAEVFGPRWKGSNLLQAVGMCWQPPLSGG